MGLYFEVISSPLGLKRIVIAKDPPKEISEPKDRFVMTNLLLALKGMPHELPPLDIDDLTPFRKEVLEAIRGIPFGKRLTYGELARLVGRPKGGRAVGQALGWNPVPIFFP